MTAGQQRFIEAFDPERFRREAYGIVDVIAAHLQRCVDGTDKKVLPAPGPEEVYQAWHSDFASQADFALQAFMERVIENSNHLHHPKYMGHQVSSPLPEAALADFVSSFLNNGSVVYEMGPVAAAMEKICVEWMAGQIGYGPEADGVLTSGGTLGNLTALLAARQAQARYDIWNEGLREHGPMAVLVSEQAHYSVKRAVQVMGLGEAGAILVPSDAECRMDIAALRESYATASAQGIHVLAVVACACSTATGSYDDLESIADFCEEKGLWMHVDGAHGASALLSDKYKHYLKGIQRADSVVWDAHKMMMMPTLVTGVIYKKGQHSYETFSQKASYILSRDHNWGDMGLRTAECSKDMMALKLYTALKMRGREFFGAYIDYVYDLTRRFAEYLKASGDFELAVMPDGNIICFRYIGKQGDLNEIQESIRRKLAASEEYYIVKTTLNDKLYLRCTVINPLTGWDDLVGLAERVRQYA
ncbi:MAG: aminotransferase class I/II-fold pyridoxal phosphate-dependent enzyme [Syntrophomonadaceae bacterium]|nr:aminotransferase class I/II-fold pyridoxal phosphate-dependent enzyme [Syntrophomonadaceae bacterium]